jgi:Putative transposase
LAADPKSIGTDRLGFFGVLLTWGGTLEYHPHVHYVVPGGGLSPDGDRWLASRADFLVPVKALSILSEGAALRVPEPGERGGAGAGAVADRVVGREDVRAPGASG